MQKTIEGWVRRGFAERTERAKQDTGSRTSQEPAAETAPSPFEIPLLLRRVQPVRPSSRSPERNPVADLFMRPEQEAARFQLQLRGLSPDQGYTNPDDDALARTARGSPLLLGQRAPDLGQTLEMVGRWRQQARAATGINGRGYVPSAGDELLLARAIFAETGSIPGDADALGWAIVNRIGNREYGRTLSDVLHQPTQYEFLVEVGSRDPNGSRQWQLSANPERMDPQSRAAWERALRSARSILSGETADPTGGATHYFAHPRYRPEDPRTIPYSFFRQRVREGRFVPSPFASTARGANRNHFFVDRGARR
jgi:hypothetical protein